MQNENTTRVEVGGFFEFPEYATNDDGGSVLHHLTSGFGNRELQSHFIRDGRQAIASVLISREQGIRTRTCYLPAYLCSSMLLPFTERRLRVKFYSHQYPLRPEIDLGVKDSLVFINDTFGAPVLTHREIQELEENNNIIILDTSHSILDPSRFVSHGSDFFIIASLRKIFPVPDGGIVFSTNPGFHPDLSSPTEWEPMLEAMFLKKFYLASKSRNDAAFIKEHFLYLNQMYNETKNHIPETLSAIPDISLHILNRLSFSMIVEKRKANLSHVFGSINERYRLFEPDDITSPYFAPILFSDGEKRDQFKSDCIKTDLYTPIIWPIPPEVPQSFRYEHDLSRRLLCIPIDQRYNPQSYDGVMDLFQGIKE
jgi:hypothetical protein